MFRVFCKIENIIIIIVKLINIPHHFYNIYLHIRHFLALKTAI